MPQSQLILIGGFLGAGKTSLIGQLARKLADRGQQVGMITNDQGTGLVDTATAQAMELAMVSEVTGGCFCCRLDDLVDRLGEHLERHDGTLTLLAEPVGSCTDLMATVILPLKERYALDLEISAFPVILDARRARSALGGKRRRRDFSKDVGYIYRKQIEEAQWLVVNKTDLMSEDDLSDLLSRLEKAHPEKRVFTVSGLTGEGCYACSPSSPPMPARCSYPSILSTPLGQIRAARSSMLLSTGRVVEPRRKDRLRLVRRLRHRRRPDLTSYLRLRPGRS